jgi:peptidoglycan LD-endopeptidase LytH
MPPPALRRAGRPEILESMTGDPGWRSWPVASFFGVAAMLAVAALGAARADRAAQPEASPGDVPASSPTTRASYAALLSPTAAAAWHAAAARALEASPVIEAPYVEYGRFAAGPPDALAYRVPLLAGETLRLELRAEAALLLEVVDARGAVLASEPTNGEGSDGLALEYRADTDADVFALLQPRPGDDARYALAVSRTAALRFPVAGLDENAIIGQFLDPRDGGARSHRGVDIHAAHGTPVLAAADGVVERVDSTTLGGRVIWLRELRSERRHYYAHLAEQHVTEGQPVRAGQPIGTVGSTGNAVESAPHLHFGVYLADHVLNPYRLLRHAHAGEPPDTRDPLPRGPAVTRFGSAAFRTGNAAASAARVLARGDTVEILAAAGRYARVRDGDGREGFIAAWLLAPLPRR